MKEEEFEERFAAYVDDYRRFGVFDKEQVQEEVSRMQGLVASAKAQARSEREKRSTSLVPASGVVVGASFDLMQFEEVVRKLKQKLWVAYGVAAVSVAAVILSSMTNTRLTREVSGLEDRLMELTPLFEENREHLVGVWVPERDLLSAEAWINERGKATDYLAKKVGDGSVFSMRISKDGSVRAMTSLPRYKYSKSSKTVEYSLNSKIEVVDGRIMIFCDYVAGGYPFDMELSRLPRDRLMLQEFDRSDGLHWKNGVGEYKVLARLPSKHHPSKWHE